jgi:hypothetical protein
MNMNNNAEIVRLPVAPGVEAPNVSPLEALLGEVNRTNARIEWLETIVGRLSISEMFGDSETIEQYESQAGRMGHMSKADSKAMTPSARVRWALATEGERKQTQVKRRNGIHPAITLLMEERKHLVNVTARCLAIGIKLDSIELTKRQGEQILAGILSFAELAGLDLQSDGVKSAMSKALATLSDSPN